MVKEIPTFENLSSFVPFRKVRELTPAFLVGQLLDVQNKYDQFYYREVHDDNDLREAHLKFMSDAAQFKHWLKETTADILEIYHLYSDLRTEIFKFKRLANEYTRRIAKARDVAAEYGIDLIDPLSQQQQLAKEVQGKNEELMRRKKKMDDIEHEITITEAMLQKKKSEMQLALQHRYTLTPTQKQILIEEKDMILDGIETWGSISGALKHNPKITSKASTIMLYCQQFPEFNELLPAAPFASSYSSSIASCTLSESISLL